MKKQNAFQNIRRSNGLTQAQVSDQLGMSLKTYRLKEREPGRFKMSEVRSAYNKSSPATREAIIRAVVLYIRS